MCASLPSHYPYSTRSQIVRLSRKTGANLLVFLIIAALVYLIGRLILGAWPMWIGMWSMMGFGPLGFWLGPVILLIVVLGLGALWLAGRGDQPIDPSTAAGTEHCPQCRARIQADYILCPECHTALGRSCPECRQPLKAHWTRCPRCGTDVEPAPATRRLVTNGGHDGTAVEQFRQRER